MGADRTPTAFGWYLLEHMANRQPPMSQAELAKAMDVSASTITRWIYDTENPGPNLLRKAADALGTDYRELLVTVGYVDTTAPAPTPTAQPDPDEVTRLREILASPLIGDTERATILAVISGVIQPYWDRIAKTRQPARRRRTG